MFAFCCLLLPCVGNSKRTALQTAQKKGQTWLLPQHYNHHGSQQQGTTGMERTVPVRGPVQWVEVEIMVTCGQSCGGAGGTVFPSLRSHKRDWNNLPRCHRFSPFLSASGESQSLGTQPAVRLLCNDR